MGIFRRQEARSDLLHHDPGIGVCVDIDQAGYDRLIPQIFYFYRLVIKWNIFLWSNVFNDVVIHDDCA